MYYHSLETVFRFLPQLPGLQIKENGLGDKTHVRYSGPTYIAIRSGKHSSSTALSHGRDIEQLLMEKDFEFTHEDFYGKNKTNLVHNS